MSQNPVHHLTLTGTPLESAARALCTLRGVDPDSIMRIAIDDSEMPAKLPAWRVMAKELVAVYQCISALDTAGMLHVVHKDQHTEEGSAERS